MFQIHFLNTYYEALNLKEFSLYNLDLDCLM